MSQLSIGDRESLGSERYKARTAVAIIDAKRVFIINFFKYYWIK